MRLPPTLRAAAPLLALALAAGCRKEAAGPHQAEMPAGDETDADVADTAGSHGRWRLARGQEGESEKRLQELRAIGYSAGTQPGSGRSGVVVHDPRATPGDCFYTSGHAPVAILMDTDGKVLHEWRRSFDELWPGDDVPETNQNRAFWRRALLLPDGSVIAIFEGLGVFRLDRASNVVWAARNGAHHDLQLLPSGELWVLTREAHVVPRVSPTEPILEDFLTLLDANGKEERRVSVIECFENGGYPAIWSSSKLKVGDVTHTNTVFVLDGSLAERAPIFAKGRILTSSPRLDRVFLIDPDQERVVRVWNADFFGQHDPSLLPNGDMLVFDNHGDRGASRVVELDPITSKVLWQYRGTPEHPFFSRTCGTAQRFANGNTLITESDNGRAFEVTKDGEIVWEFDSPHRTGPDGRFVATLFEMLRLPPDFPLGWAR